MERFSMKKMKISGSLVLLFIAIFSSIAAQDISAFLKGKPLPPPRATPAAWLLELNAADSLIDLGVSVAAFLPNTRLDWHHHPGGQVLIFTEGTGYYQERRKTKQIVRKGDVIKCLPGIEHWHGASFESGVTYIAVSPAKKGRTVWLEKVTDEQYNSAASQ